MEQNSELSIERYSPDSAVGLSLQQVEQRVAQGLVNHHTEVPTKTIPQIIKGNVFTLFNLINVILAVLVLMVGSYKNVLFMGVIICNTLIGTFQEIRAKKTIDRLSLISAPRAKVLRDGVKEQIPVNELVLDDVMVLEAGNQVCSDAVVVSGECDVNESLLTGESDPVSKKPGDVLMSGSFIVSGTVHARVEHVGAENYAARISSGAKYIKKPNSEIMNSINLIIKVIGFIIIPLGAILFYKQIFVANQPFDEAIVSTVAAIIGMIPEGLVLLTSVVLAVSVIRLSQHKTLVQELYCIETLARVDVLCLDKTGTITEGDMQVEEVLPLGTASLEQAEQALAALVHSLDDSNPTFYALKDRYGEVECSWKSTALLPFSSAKKWSGAAFPQGSFVLGASEFILREGYEAIRPTVEQYSAQGSRVLLLARSSAAFRGKELPGQLEPMALILIGDKIRPEARKTLEYFDDQGVDLKIISGDNAVTVANIAKRAGLKEADRFIDASTLQTEEEVKAAAEQYSVFGRVTPQQKLQLVQALKEKKHTVAMTGDGVNDVLALKEADCSIAMASGSDAARNVSQLVLLDSNFASMPKIVAEGRRSINNIQRSSSLFLVKTIFSVILGLIFVFINHPYPFEPIQLTLINAVTIGIPSFFLALEPNKERIQGRFIYNVIRKSIPGALVVVLGVIASVVIGDYMQLTGDQISTVAALVTATAGFCVLYRVCKPFQLWRRLLFGALLCIFILALLLFRTLFAFEAPTLHMLLLLLPQMLLCYPVMKLFLFVVNGVLRDREKVAG